MNVLEEFTAVACRELGLDQSSVDRDLILDLAKDVAHGVTRPAAPLSAFLVGLAAGRASGSLDDVRDAAAKVATLAASFPGSDAD